MIPHNSTSFAVSCTWW